MQKIKIGHRANFRAKNKYFPQILFLVRPILRSINFQCTDFNTDSADTCILVMACIDCARMCTLKPFQALILNPVPLILFPNKFLLFQNWCKKQKKIIGRFLYLELIQRSFYQIRTDWSII